MDKAATGLGDLDGLQSPTPDWFREALAVPRREHEVTVNRGRIHGFSWGDPGKPAVLFTHGMMAHSRCWAFIAPLLARHFHLAAFDISGMGDSSWHDEYSYEQRAAEALAFAEALEMDRPVLVCHSFGGSVGLQFAETYPDSIAGLVICDMTMLRPADLADFEAQRMARPGFANPHPTNKIYADLATAMARFRLAPEQPCENDFLFEYMAYHSLREVEGGYQWKFDRGVLSRTPNTDSEWWLSLAPRFAQLDLPKAIIHGALSSLFQPHTADYLSEICGPDVPIVPIEGAHHHVMLDQPLALAAVLSALLQTF